MSPVAPPSVSPTKTYVADCVSALRLHWQSLEQSQNSVVQFGLAGLSQSSQWVKTHCPDQVKTTTLKQAKNIEQRLDAVVGRLDDAVTDTVKKVSSSPRVASLTAVSSAVSAQIEAHKGASVAELVRRSQQHSRSLAMKAVDYVQQTASRFHSERVQPVIHVDLIKYTKQVIDGCGGTVSPLFASFSAVKDQADATIAQLQKLVPKQVDSVNEKLSQRRQAFKARMALAYAHARSQAMQSVTPLTSKVTDLQKRLVFVLEQVPVVDLPKESVSFLIDTVSSLTPQSVSKFSVQIQGSTDPILTKIKESLSSVADVMAVNKALALGSFFSPGVKAKEE